MESGKHDAAVGSDHVGEGPVLDAIVSALGGPASVRPVEAIRAAEAARGEINARLIAVIEETHRAAREGNVTAGNGHIFAMLLLAEFEDTSAFDSVAALCSLPSDTLDRLFGDFITEDLGRVLASLSGGRIDRLAALVEDRTRDEYVRGAALSAVAALVPRRMLPEAAAADYLRYLLRGGLEREPSAVWDEAGNLVLDLYVADLFDDLRAVMRAGLIAPGVMGPPDIDDAIREGRAQLRARLDANPHYAPVRDVVAATEWWSHSSAGADDADADDDDSEHWDDDEDAFHHCDDPSCADHAPTTVRRGAPKVGRNDPCPCGSGRKYKKCCLEAG
jgi:hypothetical protein